MSKQRVTTIVGLVVVGLLGLGFAMELGGAAHESSLVDPGVVVRWGTPISKFLLSAALALVIGGLAVRLFAVAPGSAADRVNTLTLGASVALPFTMVAYGFFTFLTVYGEPARFDAGFDASLQYFLAETDLGHLLISATVMSAVVTLVLVLTRTWFGAAAAFFVAIATAWPFAEMSHSGGTANHGIAVSALVLHIVFVSMWTGGLVAVIVAMAAGADRGTILRRYSSIALLSISIVAITGVASAAVRIGSWDKLVSAYGIIVLLKVVVTVVLALLGIRWRRSLIPAIHTSKGVVSFALLETALLVFVVGLATGLGRTATPVSTELVGELTPAEILTGRAVPEPWTWATAVTEWRIDLIWGLFAVFTTIFYVWGVARLRRRGDEWPISRTIHWVWAMLVLLYATNGGVAVYGEYLFSAHMIEHMLLTMLVPVGIVLSAPVTLVARAIEPRKDGSRGMREWFLGIVHSRWVGLVGHPLVSTVVFALSLMVFYYSPLLSWATTTHLGHQWMVLHFLTSGYLFVQALIGVDPSPHRTAYPIRMILLMATMGFHAFFGLSLMTANGLLLPEWFGAMGRTWGDTPIVDQQNGGGIAWGIGELPTLILSGLVILSWIKSDEREAKRLDRQAVRDGDAELEAYNEMLGKISRSR
ncbi:MAG: cytochrome c oxidase assembly protein [Microbacteriaceae bacterium]